MLIFLDIDGVLATEECFRFDSGRDEEHRKPGGLCESVKLPGERDTDFPYPLDPACVARFNRLAKTSGARVVLSSSWRRSGPLQALNVFFARNGIAYDHLPFSTTPCGWSDPEQLERYAEMGAENNGGKIKKSLVRRFGQSPQRGHEICAWLGREGFDGPFVVLDDDGDMDGVEHRFVRTDTYKGLLDEHVEEALKVLAR